MSDERNLELELELARARLRVAELELATMRPELDTLRVWRDGILSRAARAGRPDALGLCDWFEAAAALARDAAGIGKTAFVLGWLDATWSGFGLGSRVDMPDDIRRVLVRKGWLAPKSTPDEQGARRVTITPSGMQQVLSINKAYRVRRTIRLEDGSEREL